MYGSNDFQKALITAQTVLANNDPTLKVLIERYGPCRVAPHDNHYGALVDSIISQQLSVKAAAAIKKRVLALFGDEMPSPAQLIALEDEALRAAGLSYSKIKYLQDLAQHIMDGRLDMKHISSLPNDELIEQLTAVKGIGQWSAHMFMIFSLGRLDILPTGDLGVRKAMQQLYSLEHLPDPAEMQLIADHNNWTPYQSIASWYLWRSLENN